MSDVVPGEFREWFRGFFAWRLRKGFPKSFHAVRLANGSRATLDAAAAHPGPIVIASNHQSWWDPLVGFLVHDAWFRGRRP